MSNHHPNSPERAEENQLVAMRFSDFFCHVSLCRILLGMRRWVEKRHHLFSASRRDATPNPLQDASLTGCGDFLQFFLPSVASLRDAVEVHLSCGTAFPMVGTARVIASEARQLSSIMRKAFSLADIGVMFMRKAFRLNTKHLT